MELAMSSVDQQHAAAIACIPINLSFHQYDLGLEALHSILSSRDEPAWHKAVIKHVLRSGALPPGMPTELKPSPERLNVRLKLYASDPLLTSTFACIAAMGTSDARAYAVRRLLAHATKHIVLSQPDTLEHLQIYRAAFDGHSAPASPHATPVEIPANSAPIVASEMPAQALATSAALPPTQAPANDGGGARKKIAKPRLSLGGTRY